MSVEKLHIGGVEQDAERCLRCGSQFLDTGWECTDCGYDNIEHYCPPEVLAAALTAQPGGSDNE